MKRVFYFVPVMALLLMLTGCTGGNDIADFEDWIENGGGGGGNSIPGSQGGAGSSTTADDDLEDFTVEFDYSALSETETIPTDATDASYEDYVENNDFTSTITITYADGSASVSGSVSGVTVTTSGAHVTVNSTAKKVEYVLKGSSSNGSFKLYGEKKYKLTLNGLTLTNPTGAAINDQSGKRVFICLADGTTNSLTDGTSYDKVEGEDMKACLFAEGKLLFSGTGTLNVTGQYKHGICADDYIRIRPGVQINVTSSASNGLKANDGVYINGGVLNIGVTGTAAKGISSDGDMLVAGGRTTIIKKSPKTAPIHPKCR